MISVEALLNRYHLLRVFGVLVWSLSGMGAIDTGYVTVTGILPPGGASFSVRQSQLISELRYPALLRWAEMNVDRNQYEIMRKGIQQEEAERYIVGYKVGRLSSNKSQMEVTFHVDVKEVKRFLKLTHLEAGGRIAKTLFVVSSKVQNLELLSADVPRLVKEHPLVKQLFSLSVQSLGKLRIRPEVQSLSGIPEAPPIGELASFRRWLNDKGYGLVLWFHFIPCEGCRGVRMETFMVNAFQFREVLIRSDDLVITEKEYGSDKWKAVLEEPFDGIEGQIQEISSAGRLWSHTYCAQVDGLGSTRDYSKVLTDLGQVDSVTQVLPLQAKPGNVMLELLSPLSSAEFAQETEKWSRTLKIRLVDCPS